MSYNRHDKTGRHFNGEVLELCHTAGWHIMATELVVIEHS